MGLHRELSGLTTAIMYLPKGGKSDRLFASEHSSEVWGLEHLDVSHLQQIRLMKRCFETDDFNITSLLKGFSLNSEPTRWELKQHVSRSASSGSSPLFASAVHVSRQSAECTTTNASQFWLFYFHSEFTWRLHSTQGQMYCMAWLMGNLHQIYSSWVMQLVIKLFRQKCNC